ncbi:MAG: ATP-binding protein [Thermoanaerobaculia bacterium]|nr:ATP-binding protein [Thermoanaerobaculia bacterium]
MSLLLPRATRRRGASPLRRTRFSLAGRIAAGFVGILVLSAAAAAASTLLPLDPWTLFLLVLLVTLPLGVWLIGRLLRPLDRVIRGLTDGISSFHDRDFSMRLAYRRGDELGELVDLYNQVGEILLEERRALTQRELLLKSALDRSPVATVLVNPLGRVIYSNREARTLFVAGESLEGMSFEALRDGSPPEMREILDAEGDGLFTVDADDGQTETYHLSQRLFTVNRRRHRLLLLRRMTSELGRQEARIWKKVIRVISHELNNSLAPISSLVHSAKLIAADPRHAERSGEVFATLRERLDHLKGFIDGYARYARLPQPRKQRVAWDDFLAGFADEHPGVELPRRLPTRPGWFDPAQIRQVLVNLIKNAVEASDGEPRVTLAVETGPEGDTWLQVADRGRGMDDETMRLALLPFYSTKKTGTGVGLPLCREVVEGHGGKLTLASREGGGTVVTCWLPPPLGEG